MKLSRQLALAFAAAAAAPVVAAAPLVLRTVSETVHGEVARRLDGAVRAAEAEGRAIADEVDRGLAAAATSDELRGLAARRAGGLVDPAAEAALAARLLPVTGLSILAILELDGRVISSGHLPARAGDRDPALSAIDAGPPGLARVEVAGAAGIATVPALVARRDAAGLRVVAGAALAEAAATRLARAAGARVELLDADGSVLAAAGAEPAPELPGLADRLALALLDDAAPAARTLPLLPPEGAGRGARSLAVPRPAALPSATGAPALRLSVDARALRHAQARILAASGGILLASVLLAAALGALLARRIVRPLEALAAGAARVAGGDLETRVEARAGGEVATLVGSFNAMTAELRRTRERAAVAERVAAWREVARRLAHEIKNPLAPIAMSIETLRDAHAARSPLLDEIFDASSRTILDEVARLKRIVDEFSRFARLPPPELRPVSLPALCDAVLALYPGALRRELSPAPEVQADRDQLTQVLLNLVENAKAAAGGAGTVVVRTGVDADGAAFLEVEDDGPGIPADRLERIFEPYFTTKAGGTGLGLPIARRIAEEHGGRLEVESAPGDGARFRLTLPARSC